MTRFMIPLLLALVVGLPQPSFAIGFNGTQFLKLCDQSPDACLAYVGGVLSGFKTGIIHSNGEQIYCPPSMNNGLKQYATIALTHLRNHREDLDKDATVIIVGSITAAFPCK
jgi:hypothetical protein